VIIKRGGEGEETMNTVKNNKGFTIIEVIIAIIVLTVGVLGMVTTAALVTRMIGRGSGPLRPPRLRAGGSSACGSRLAWTRSASTAATPCTAERRGGAQQLDVYKCRDQELPLKIVVFTRPNGTKLAETHRRPRFHANPFK